MAKKLGYQSFLNQTNLILKRPNQLKNLNQIKSISYQEIFVQGDPEQSDQATINRFPTLMDAVLLNIKNEKKFYFCIFFSLSVYDTKAKIYC